jgi:hypothetical protein
MNAYLVNGSLVWEENALEAIKLIKELTLTKEILEADYVPPETVVYLVKVDDEFIEGEKIQFWTLNQLDGEVALESTVGEVTKDMENSL